MKTIITITKSGVIRSVSLKKYGKRLYNLASIDAFLASQEAREIQENTASAGGGQ